MMPRACSTPSRSIPTVLLWALSVGCAAEDDAEEGDLASSTAAHTTDSPGEPAWVRVVQGGDIDSTLSDGAAGTYITGSFDRFVEIGDFRHEAPLTSVDGRPTFLAHLDAFGELIWARAFDEHGLGLSLQDRDAAGNLILVAASDGDDLDFGCGPSAAGVYLVKLTAEGDCLFTQRFERRVDPPRFSISAAADGEDIVVGGNFSGRITLGGATFTAHGYPEVLSQDIYLARLDRDGKVVWAKQWGLAPPDDPIPEYVLLQRLDDLDVDGNGNIVFVGQFSGGIDFGGGPLSADDGIAFVVKLRRSGSFVFARQFGGSAWPTSVAVADNGAFAVAGYFFEGTLDFGNTSITTPGPTYDTFLVRYSFDGVDRWSRHLHGNAPGIIPTGVAIDHHGTVAVTGNFYDGSLNIGSRRWETTNQQGFAAVIGSTSGAVKWARVFGGTPGALSLVGAPSFTTNSRLMVGGQYDGTPMDVGADEPLPPGGEGFLVRYYP